MEIDLRAPSLAALLLLLGGGPAAAADINVVATTAGKAVVSINGGKPRTLTPGQITPEGVRLVSATSESAVFEFAGKRQTLAPGQSGVYGTGPAQADRGGGKATFTADSRGHFIVNGQVNDINLRFMVDTGASVVALSKEDAARAGVNHLEGTRRRVQTANGLMLVYQVKLARVQVGDITLTDVDAVVVAEEGKLAVSLLGMSFLNRMEMRRDGDTLTLIRRF